MSRLDALEALLDETRELLQDADDLTVSEALERGEAPDAREWEEELACEFCGHGWHGLSCYEPPQYRPVDWNEGVIDTFALFVTKPGRGDCRCDGSMQRKDDTWRPVAPDWRYRSYRVQRLMDLHGVDGWAAQELIRNPDLWRRARKEAMQAGRVWFAPLDGTVEWAEIGSLRLEDLTFTFAEQVQHVGRAAGRMVESMRQLTFVDRSVSFDVAPARSVDAALSDAEVAIFQARQARSGTGPSRPGPEAQRRPRRI